MTDQEFLEADFDALLQAMTLDEINTRHDAIDAKRAKAQAAEEADFLSEVVALKKPYAQARRRCISCEEWLQPMATRCSECGESLPVISASERING